MSVTSDLQNLRQTLASKNSCTAEDLERAIHLVITAIEKLEIRIEELENRKMDDHSYPGSQGMGLGGG